MRLSAVSGPHAGRVFEVRGELSVGRGARCTLPLNDPNVSRRHASLTGDRRSLVVRDEGSLNGTWLNDRRITEPRHLNVGDRLRIGGSEFVVFDADGLDQDAQERNVSADGQPVFDATLAGESRPVRTLRSRVPPAGHDLRVGGGP